MKKILSILLCFLAATSIFAETIKIACTDYEPLVKYDANKTTGEFVEIVDESFKKVGINVVYENYPWLRAQIMTKENAVDAVIILFKTKEREKDFLFSNPVMTARNKFFYIKGKNIPEKFQWNNISDFKNFKIGGVIGYWYIKRFEDAGIALDLVASDDQNIQKMYAGRIDTFVGDEVFGWNLIKKYYPNEVGKFATIDKPESEVLRYVLFGKNNPKAPKLIEKFNQGLEQLKKSGEYDKILEKYEKIQ